MGPVLLILLGLLVALAVVVLVPPLRRPLLGRPIMAVMSRFLPRMSETEREALEAGTVWWDADLFGGAPDWRKIIDTRLPGLTEREKAFLDGPVQEVCRLTSHWQTTQTGDLPEEVWDYLKEHGFFGIIIPEEHGGLGFSALAHSAVVSFCASRSVALAVTVMVPNSLGPAELILHYGTDAQKRHFLPRLADGREIPCFALTEPGAGSDAAGLSSEGVVCHGSYEGRQVLGMRLDWDKRYATLAPVATIIGLAFRLRDPDGLLGERQDLGITCALIPADLPGIEIGERHDPLGVPFHNGPIRARNVFVPLDFIIGGAEGVGRGWSMLMQSLAAGRSISLPSLASGAAELCTRATGAYASVREQFGLPIGRFEGIQEPLARIGAMTYLMNAARVVTAGAVDLGERPSVLSAVVKCYLTEEMRRCVNEAMDVLAGAGISQGPNNIMAGAYTSIPIGITVEGANILTRTLIIFGQGAMRCHPFAREEVQAVAEGDLARFDRAFFGHARFVLGNALRCAGHALTGSLLAGRPVPGAAGRTFQKLSRLSAAFALCADAAMATLGGDLKRREKLSGRLADALSWLYLATATHKYHIDRGSPRRDRPCVDWATAHALLQIQEALIGFLDNLPSRPVRGLLRMLIFPFGRPYRAPSDRLGSQVARGLLDGGELWQALTRHIFIPTEEEPALGRLERALRLVVEARPLEARLREAVRSGTLARQPAADLAPRAVTAGVLTAADLRLLEQAREARRQAIAVDAVARQETVSVQP